MLHLYSHRTVSAVRRWVLVVVAGVNQSWPGQARTRARVRGGVGGREALGIVEVEQRFFLTKDEADFSRSYFIRRGAPVGSRCHLSARTPSFRLVYSCTRRRPRSFALKAWTDQPTCLYPAVTPLVGFVRVLMFCILCTPGQVAMTQHLFPQSIKAGVELDPAAIQVTSAEGARFFRHRSVD